MSNKYPLLKKDIEEAPLIFFGDYPYLVLKVGNGIPYIDSPLLEEVTNGLLSVCDFNVDKIVCPEPMGTYLGAILSYLSGVRVTFLRRRKFGLPDEIAIRQETKFEKTTLYVNGLKANEKVTIIDDVISSGATLISIITSLLKSGLHVKDVGVAVSKGRGVINVKRRTGIEVKYLAAVKVQKDRRTILL